MKIINSLIDRFGIGGLMIGSIICGLAAIILLLSVIFNFPPYITFNKGSTFGMTEYARGVPVPVKISSVVNFPDTNIVIKTKSGTRTNYDLNQYTDTRWALPADDTIAYTDTIFSHIKLLDNHHLNANEFELVSGIVYVKPGTLGQRLLFNLPMILKFVIIGYCAWQVALLLSFIRSGQSFKNSNYRRLLNIGWALIAFTFALFFLEFFQDRFRVVTVRFTSTIHGYRQPFLLSGDTYAQLNILLLVVGCVFLITAQAFQKGNKLQQEQDLTI